MEYIRKFNEAEQEIHDICCENKVDYEKIDFLLKNGASANSVEIVKYNDKIEEELLLVQCWLDGLCGQYDNKGYIKDVKEDFCIKLLTLFINNGLDIDKYVNHILRDIHFTSDRKHLLEMIKLILNNLNDKNNLNLEESLSGVGSEESYQNCCEADHKYANIFSTAYEMIERFAKGKDVNKIDSCEKIVGNKINEIQIYYKDLKVDMSNKFISDCFDIFIKCDKNILCIKNNYIFIDNNPISSEYEEITKKEKQENRLEGSNEVFLRHINEYLKNETITKIDFFNEHVELTASTFSEVTILEIDISNNKKIIISLDESYTNMKITIK